MSEPVEVGDLRVVASDDQHLPLDARRWETLARDVLAASGVGDGELNLLFVTDDEMAELNRQHMGGDRATDVLSFPLDAVADDDGPGEVLLGDVVICPAVAERQASEHGGERGHDGSVDDELALLVVHGVLHVLGHDHAAPAEAEVMQALEDELLARWYRS